MSKTMIEIDGKTYSPNHCLFETVISTESWCDDQREWLYGPDFLGVNYSVDITVNNHSGEDGAPAPAAQCIPIHLATNGKNILPHELPGLMVSGHEGYWEAWYGNDAPELINNRMEFLKWHENKLFVDWTADYVLYRVDAIEQLGHLHFRGALLSSAITMNVKSEKDIDPFFKLAFGDESLSRVIKKISEWSDYGPSFPENRRKWLNVSFSPAK